MSSTQIQGPTHSERTQSVVMGRQDYLSVLLRLVGMELYKIRRRTMSKVLGIISIVVVIFTLLLFAAITVSQVQTPASAFGPQTCSSSDNAPGCTNAPLPDSERAQIKQEAIRGVSEILRLPLSLSALTAVLQRLGMILIIILVGSIVGGEYGSGTIRLMFTRGPTRGQFLLAKVGAAIASSAISIVGLTLFGIVLGLLLNTSSGIAQDFGFFTAGWFGHALLFELIVILGLFVYAMMALFLGTMGRTAAAGVAGALAWSLLEPIVGTVLTAFGHSIAGSLGTILADIPNYFIGNNIDALLQNQSRHLFNGQPATLTDLHALIVLAAYLVIFVGLAWWATLRRDVTN